MQTDDLNREADEKQRSKEGGTAWLQAGIADAYARYRPTYPEALFHYILQFVPAHDAAWDCGTGNGQAALVLSQYFQRVEATDISEAQLRNAAKKENINYGLAPAEKTTFPDNSFDLITVATAYHWLNWEAFHREATRVGKPDAVVAAWAYNLVNCTDEKIDAAIHAFYFKVMYDYWDAGRRHVETAYANVAFNFTPLPATSFFISREWTKEDLLGYITTWSAVPNYKKQNRTSPLPLLEEVLKTAWPDAGLRSFRFPLFLRIGRVTK